MAADILHNFHAFGIYIPDQQKRENVLITSGHSKQIADTDAARAAVRQQWQPNDAMVGDTKDPKSP